MNNERGYTKIIAAIVAVAVIALAVIILMPGDEDGIWVDVTCEGEGAVDPIGKVQVEDGGSLTIAISPSEGWELASVKVDGKPVSIQDGKLTLEGITSSKKVHVEFAKADMVLLNVIVGENGVSTITGETVIPLGETVEAMFTPRDGYVIEDVLVDGESIGSINYVSIEMDTDHEVEVKFRAAAAKDPTVTIDVDVDTVEPHTLGADPFDFGTIAPYGTFRVAYGGSLVIMIDLKDGYSLGSLKVDGVEMAGSGTFTIEDIVESVTVDAGIDRVVENIHTITASAGTGGSISPSGSVKVAEGDSVTFTVTAKSGYKLKSLTVDGATVSGSSYTFSNVTANHTISAQFERTSSGGGGGGYTPPIHIHSYGAWVDNGDGTHSKTCSCSHVVTEDCNFVNPVNEGPDGHDMTCSVCSGETSVAHTFPDVVSCTESASCVCGYERAPISHNFDEISKKSPEDLEHHAKVCSNCGETKDEAHTWNVGVDQNDATCTEMGSSLYTCSGCGQTRSVQNVDALGHNFTGSYVKVGEGGADGHARKCIRCDAYGTVVAHAYDGSDCDTEYTLECSVNSS